MARELMTSWADYQAAIDQILQLANEHIFIYDEDLGLLKLESPARLDQIKRILLVGKSDCLQIALRNAQPMTRNNPQTLNLLTVYNHKTKARQTPPTLAHLRDSMILIDGKHGLIRFDREQPRSKLLIEEAGELRPYYHRFQEIIDQSGETIGSGTLGL
ncbi:hypothetical protein GBK02_13815 [Dechloromonas sp. TW-R-39-2]|uniref:DUF7931 domain-containing protein n=1 Tax=Dechloromonas sp. TW-R-39-2 TaxID=2654218 RepID=UPI00193DE049|nr:hypothetical protein [Dechloromonas sp. TW-R-39-2]QRM20389.1 hypothetical protein GBK02_13815 [Dechloromonas sp. TW-R-39-2]